MRKVAVDLGAESYAIYIGNSIQKELLEFLKAQSFSQNALLVTDTNVEPLYGERVKNLLEEAGLRAHVVSIPAGESSKSLAMADQVYTEAIEAGLDRKSPVIALGGGVVGDLAGFIAATYMRGVPFLQMPTSLLAQVDSSVGGKVAVNHRLGKNLIGAFYQPKGVFMDMTCLDTLPDRELYTGLGEIVKSGVIADAAFFSYLEEHAEAILHKAPKEMVHLVARSSEIKADVVGQDEKEAGLRRILNFGHTIAHAIEKETGYKRYNHGEAVAIGMLGAADISCQLGLARAEDMERLKKLIERLRLPTKAEGCTVDAMYQDISHDKKTIGGKVHWVLMNGIGSVTVRSDVPEHVVRSAMQHCIEG